jgi:hypothetical protein
MALNGGLKLNLAGVGQNDRRLRAARLVVATAEGQDRRALVTDSRGRLRYHLAAGEYRLELADGDETGFTVADGRWTLVHLQLP